MQPSRSIDGLIAIMAALRSPNTGCKWDLEQNFASIAPYTVEEAYEVADAINRHNMPDLCEELGDLLLQVVFHARMAEELGYFTFADVCEAITTKLIRRHPHVFGNAQSLHPDEVKDLWNKIKEQEKDEKTAKQVGAGLPPSETAFLDQVPRTLPALTEAFKLQKKAASVGFDWNNVDQVFDKLNEELDELKQSLADNDSAATREELGDLLFVVANIARKLKIDPEQALNDGNIKFRRRFGYIETELHRDDRSFLQSDLNEMERLWSEAKLKEKHTSN
jgi:nucleoside triphosphate diphosphatase